MYTVRLMLDVNFTAASGSVFKSVVGVEDLNNITEDLLQAMQTQDNVTTCVSGGVHVWNRYRLLGEVIVVSLSRSLSFSGVQLFKCEHLTKVGRKD